MSAERAAGIVGRMAPLLNLLPEWEITVGSAPCDEPDTAAQVRFAEHRHEALIEIGPEWPDGPEAQEKTIAHELAHVLTRDAFQAAWDAINKVEGKKTRRLLRSALMRENERLADRLAAIFTRLDLVTRPWFDDDEPGRQEQHDFRRHGLDDCPLCAGAVEPRPERTGRSCDCEASL